MRTAAPSTRRAGPTEAVEVLLHDTVAAVARAAAASAGARAPVTWRVRRAGQPQEQVPPAGVAEALGGGGPADEAVQQVAAYGEGPTHRVAAEQRIG
jgi:hypothetical protein